MSNEAEITDAFEMVLLQRLLESDFAKAA